MSAAQAEAAEARARARDERAHEVELIERVAAWREDAEGGAREVELDEARRAIEQAELRGGGKRLANASPPRSSSAGVRSTMISG